MYYRMKFCRKIFGIHGGKMQLSYCIRKHLAKRKANNILLQEQKKNNEANVDFETHTVQPHKNEVCVCVYVCEMVAM